MKEFVLLVRVNPRPLDTEAVKSIRAKWETVVEKWKNDGRYVTSNGILEEGFIVSGAERSIQKGALKDKYPMVVSTINLRAGSFEEALELAKEAPVLDFGGMVEVRERLNVPAPAQAGRP